MKKNQLRLNKTLAALVDEYIGSNEPVSSRILNEKYLQGVSTATLRLDLMKLEQLNLIPSAAYFSRQSAYHPGLPLLLTDD